MGADENVDRAQEMVASIPAGYHDVVLRQGDVAVRLREQVTSGWLNPLGLRLLLDWAADTIVELRGPDVQVAPAVARPPKFDFSRYDPDGKELVVHSTGAVFRISIETGDGHRSGLQFHELDADDTVWLAHDLLERAYVHCGCDEIEAAVVALRALADREARYEAVGLQMAGDD